MGHRKEEHADDKKVIAMAAVTLPPAQDAPNPYPVHVDAVAQPELSRWLWLVKWLLVIPHAVVLAFLWVAFVALSIVAFVSILVTGRYPRAIFDVNVGVLRWSWRVAYYANAVFGTDRYPPFTLDEVDDYPAHLRVDYPDHLSRGLVLVKWWLLALPHYLVVAFFVGAGTYTFRVASDLSWQWQSGLIGLLALVAAVTLTVTGRYPRPVFDLLLGLNRWVIRVAAYAALMTDRYPPFRLDQGEHDPGVSLVAGPRAGSVPTTRRDPWGPGRVLTVVAATVALALGLGCLAAGATAGVAHLFLRDGPYLTAPSRQFWTDGYAVVLGDVELGRPEDAAPWVAPDDWPARLFGEIRIRATGAEGEPLFVGVTSRSRADAYLAGTRHTEFGSAGRTPVDRPGGAPMTPPQSVDIWTATSSGPGTRTLELTPQPGTWVLVAMPTDGSPGALVEADVGATFPGLPRAAVTAGVLGVLLLAAGAGAVALAARPTSPARPGTTAVRDPAPRAPQ